MSKRRDKYGAIAHYSSAKSRSKRKGWTFTLTKEEIKELWERDSAHLLKEPSIDRIDPTLGYSKQNCRFIERRLNSRLGNLGKKLSESVLKVAKKNLEKGWYAVGEAASSSKLTEKQVLEIRYKNKRLNQKEIGAKYGVSPSLISLIKNHKIWKHL